VESVLGVRGMQEALTSDGSVGLMSNTKVDRIEV
jgi:hypothetical protein